MTLYSAKWVIILSFKALSWLTFEHHSVTSIQVSLYGGQVLSWKNDRGEELLFASSKVNLSIILYLCVLCFSHEIYMLLSIKSSCTGLLLLPTVTNRNFAILFRNSDESYG